MPHGHATPGKINLYLRVRARRPDGYHDIETVFLPLQGCCDRVELEPAAEGVLEVSCSHPGVPCGRENLAWKASSAYAAHAVIRPAWRIRIEKGIPVAAGLGGGSSDAGCVLRLLSQQYPGRVPQAELLDLAASVGADVPFFLNPAPMLGRGAGNRLFPLVFPGVLPVVLLSPAFPIRAAWAYRHWGRPEDLRPPPVADVTDALAKNDLAALSRLCWNDLEFAVLRKFPLLQEFREFLVRNGCSAALVSGSGPTVFGLCSEDGQKDVLRKADALFGDAVTAATARAGAIQVQ